jgi:predicted transcriptional regulator YheO
VANYIADMSGPRAESLIHDISDYNHSILYITPKNITGRKVGGPLTDYAISLLNNKVYEKTDYVVNYIGYSDYNNLILRSSTYFIKDEGQLIGLLCTNVDITDQIRATDVIKEALLIDFNQLRQNHILENFSLSTEELINRIYIKVAGQDKQRKLSVNEKRKIVSELVNLEVFKFRGSIATVATLLKVSEKTVYRYINEIKTEKK